MREEKASSSDGRKLDRRVFVSRRKSSCTIGCGGDANLRDLALDGEVKKPMGWDWDGDGSRHLLSFRGVSGTEAGGSSLKRFASALISGIDLSETSSWSVMGSCITKDRI
jgi:hypothetical protein